ncbi:ARM repeat-containing protein [Patellaria atrata CBS 101060]|uniref:ARM repeat-containing protein n=1 Tax=Patellaria atrata CBS 101060 TaxID=1346257 RepID=A0A9P4SIC9_9PEZI|nr:ARM repeat-containing protein [Patellaria atrata CBS 101060]
MFSSALKSFSSNISSNYTLSAQPSSYSGPWKIFDAKKKSTGKAASVFIFDKKSLEPQGGGLGGRSNAASLRKLHEEVLERLKKEASSLARLRHPSILELVEPVEETRSGGLQFATEPVTASLAVVLQEKDDQEKAGGVGGRRSRYVIEEADGNRKRRELEIDELEIQKGLLQIGKGLEFLHESAGLVHANLTPDAIFVNAKSDWKISGLGFASPPDNSTTPTSVIPISLSEVLNHDPRLPRSVQLNLDYTSPDFVMDTNISSAADMFSLGLLIIALYNSPHKSPLESNGSPSTYKRLFSSSSNVPSQHNNFLSAQPLPRALVTGLLPRLITRRPAQRMNAREFQQADYFDNILVSSIRFLDSLPAKTPNEKSQFMRGLPRILNQFPKSVLEKKVLPALLEEMKDRELLSLVLQNVLKIINVLPSSKRAFSEKVIPRLREIFLGAGSAKDKTAEKENLKEAGLMVLLENMGVIAENSSGKEFKDDILPLINLALESPTHSLIDAALKTLADVLPVLDFSTIKNELFPVIATVFAKTSSMGIKIRGLEALNVLCGGTNGTATPQGDGLDGVVAGKPKPKPSSSAILDKYTVQEKVVPLLKGIKTKEPAVMMAALDVFTQVGKVADSDFLAMEALPIIWAFSLGPLLNLQQFQSYMKLIKSLSSKIEQEQTRKLQELSSSNATATRSDDFMNFGVPSSNGLNSPVNGDEANFESLVLGRGKTSSNTNPLASPNEWGTSSTASLPSRPSTQRLDSQTQRSQSPAFSWSTPQAPTQPRMLSANSSSRAITPDQALSSMSALTPSNLTSHAPPSTFSQPLQPTPSSFTQPLQPNPYTQHNHSYTQPLQPTSSFPAQHLNTVDWSTAAAPANPWSTPSSSMNTMSAGQMSHNVLAPQRSTGAFGIPLPPTSSPYAGFALAPPPSGSGLVGGEMGRAAGIGAQGGGRGQSQKQGMDKYESLL